MVFEGKPFTKVVNTYYKNWQNIPEYAAMIESMDENVGRMLRFLDENGLAKITIIIFTSDNGGMLTSNQIGNIPTSN